MIDPNELLSIPTAARAAGVGRARIYQRIKQGTLTPIKIAGKIFISQAEIEIPLPVNKGGRPKKVKANGSIVS